MKVLCGTDFTPAADAALEAAQMLVERMGGDVRLVHVDERSDEGRKSAAASRPRDVADLFGTPDESIVAEAERIRADLIVVGALGRRERPRWRLGSTADRIAQQSSCPVLVVRDAEPFRRWARRERPLRIAVGLDTTAASDDLVHTLSQITAVGGCSLIGVHIYWPPEARERLHVTGGLPLGQGNREVDAVVEEELRTRIFSRTPEMPIDLRIVGGLGRIADHLIQVAEEVEADIAAVGSHKRAGFDRLWHGSVSHGVIEAAPMNVLCVPWR